ncbi:SDR family oxidoreductase (plasmid) [Halarchaeum sp. CBA1220]|uniref:oxidoreductase n=1 Tax=Halarchaeum sp. CBA1220 TaxID=1853682 RepID=UPI000F3AA52C|nr:oxidoreductase [Halarchaeum sp. CBA1220]QLC34829.1 SDR family oxidoreductase [Halarchaeum sp. CBA1220]
MFDESAEWTPTEMPAQAGRTVVVTGANSGIGYEATEAFAASGAHVVMACRSTERGRDAKADVEADYPGASLTVRELDLADLDSVRAFVDWYGSEFDALDVLCNNAGVMAIPRSETAQGFETQFGVNHLGHFALTAGLLPVLRRTTGESRVVTQSSGVHENGRIDFEDLQGEADYEKWGAYAQSKLANVLFAYELDRRLRAANASVTSVACHPGYAATNLQRRGPEAEGSRLRLLLMEAANALLAQSAERGAWPLLYAATHPSIDGGEYVGPGGFRNMRGHPTTQESSERSYDRATARRLWSVSEELTGVTYDLPAPA